MNLAEANVGEYKIKEIGYDEKSKQRFLRQGILPGKTIQLITMRKKGPCVIKVGETKMIIGFEMINGIEVADI